jgi:hypothetical protein
LNECSNHKELKKVQTTLNAIKLSKEIDVILEKNDSIQKDLLISLGAEKKQSEGKEFYDWNDKPEDVKEKYPIEKITDPYQFDKYQSATSPSLMVWLWFQVVVTLIFMYHLFGNLAEIGKPDILIYGVFLILSIYTYTELMDGNKDAVWWDLIKAMAGIIILVKFDGWFGLSGIWVIFISCYLILSVSATYYFSFLDKNRIPLKVSEMV